MNGTLFTCFEHAWIFRYMDNSFMNSYSRELWTYHRTLIILLQAVGSVFFGECGQG